MRLSAPYLTAYEKPLCIGSEEIHSFSFDEFLKVLVCLVIFKSVFIKQIGKTAFFNSVKALTGFHALAVFTDNLVAVIHVHDTFIMTYVAIITL